MHLAFESPGTVWANWYNDTINGQSCAYRTTENGTQTVPTAQCIRMQNARAGVLTQAGSEPVGYSEGWCMTNMQGGIQVGGGVQYQFTQPIESLVENGYLRRLQ